MNRLAPLIMLACIALAASGVVVFRGDGLPRSFVMTLNTDLTSSGASRTFAATLDVDSDRMSGTSRYESDPGREERIEYGCALTSGTWSDTATAGPCPIPLEIPATRAELANAIKNGSIALSESCAHKQLCYSLVAP